MEFLLLVFHTQHLRNIYATIIRGANWTPQGGGVAPDITPPEGGYKCNLWYINGAGRYYRGTDFNRS